MLNLVPCEKVVEVNDRISDQVMMRKLVLEEGKKRHEMCFTLETKEIEDWNDGKCLYFKVTDTIYLKREYDEITMVFFEPSITRGNWFAKDNFKSVDWIKVISIVDVIEQKFELRVDYVRHYSVNFFYKKPIRFHYIDDLNSINYKSITSKKLSLTLSEPNLGCQLRMRIILNSLPRLKVVQS